MTDNNPTDLPAAEGGDPDEKTVVRPRRKAEPAAAPAAETRQPEAQPVVVEAVQPPAVEPAVVQPAAVQPTPVEPAPVEAAPAAVAPATVVTPAAPVEVVPATPVQPAPYAQPASQAYYRAPQPPKGLAVASMVLGLGGLLLSFFGFGFLIDVAAVITGHIAAKRHPLAKGYWLTGIITGYLGIAFSLVYGAIWARYLFFLISGN